MKIVKISQGKEVIVDDKDYKFVMGNKWTYAKSKWGFGYACRRRNNKTELLHRVLMGNPDKHVDHINGNGLDNRRSNLRLATNSQNMCNTGIRKDNKYGLKGIGYKTGCLNPWRAYITHNGKHISLGMYKNPIEAAIAYNKKAKELFGEFAKLNTWNRTML